MITFGYEFSDFSVIATQERRRARVLSGRSSVIPGETVKVAVPDVPA